MPETKKRARRIAADEAHAWARNLRLANPNAKYVLCMLTQYVNGDGLCWVSISHLAEDCELAQNTIRSRLAWLESAGVIVRRPQWIDESGKRNGDGRGRRTSDDIQLLVDCDPVVVQNDATRSGGDEADPANPAGSNEPDPPGDPAVSPSVALQLGEGAESSEHEPEQEELPPTPLREGGGDEFSKRGIGAERLRVIEPIWPEVITDAHKAVTVLAGLSAIEWERCQLGAKGYANFIRNQRENGRQRIVKDFHNWARNRQWEGYVTKGQEVLARAQIRTVPADSIEGRAWIVLCRVGNRPVDSDRPTVLLHHDLSPQILALANAPASTHEWVFIAETESHQVGAWRALVNRELGKLSRGEMINDRSWYGHRPTRTPGFLAPWPWPPKVDGSTYDGTGPPPTSPDGVNEEAAQQFANTATSG